MTRAAAVALLGTATTVALRHLTDKQKIMLTLARAGVLDKTTATKVWGAGRRYTFDPDGYVVDICEYTTDMSRTQDRHSARA